MAPSVLSADPNDLFYNLSSAVNTTLNTNEYDSNDIEVIEPGTYIELNTEFEDETEANNAQNNLNDTNDTNTGIEVSSSRVEDTYTPEESEPEPTTNVNVDMKIGDDKNTVSNDEFLSKVSDTMGITIQDKPSFTIDLDTKITSADRESFTQSIASNLSGVIESTTTETDPDYSWISTTTVTTMNDSNIDSSSIEILPVAYAYVNYNNYNATNADDRKGVNISWSSWNNSTSRHQFTFDTPMNDANYNVVTDRNYESTNAIHIFGKSTTGFTAEWENGNPEVWAATFMVYASTPTKIIGKGIGSAVGCASSPITITVASELVSSGNSNFTYTTSDSDGNGDLFGCINAIRGSTITILVVGEYADLVSHPIKITEYNDQGQHGTKRTDVIRTDTGGQNNDGTYTLTWVVPYDTTVDKYQYQCENHAHMRGTINVSGAITVSSFSSVEGCASSPVNITVASEFISAGNSNFTYTTSDSNGNGGLFGCINAVRGSTLTISVTGEYADLVSHPIKITEYNDQGQHGTKRTDVIRTDTGGQNNDGTYTLTWVVPYDTTVDKYQYQCENHAHMRGTIHVSGIINVDVSSIEILPVAYAHVNYDNYNAVNPRDRRGINISWSSWNNYTSRHTFTFDTPMNDNNYNVVTDRNYESTNAIHIYGKSTTGFTAQWENGNPEVWDGTFMIYASTPTKTVGGTSSSIEILPVAYAYVNYDNYNALDSNDRAGINLSWSSWDNSTSRHTFTFDTPMENTNYNVVTDRNYESTNAIHIFWKTTTGFTAQWENGNPEVWGGTFIVYAESLQKRLDTI